jgi:methylase of polypeptide subunit release factors
VADAVSRKSRAANQASEVHEGVATPDGAGPNAEQIEYWNSGRPRMDRAAGAARRDDRRPARRDQQACSPRERAIDVGCGCGATTLALARRVGPRGPRARRRHLVGDARARANARARAASARRVCERHAQTHAFESGAWDACARASA